MVGGCLKVGGRTDLLESPRIPTGRGNGLKTRPVWVRIPPRAPYEQAKRIKNRISVPQSYRSSFRLGIPTRPTPPLPPCEATSPGWSGRPKTSGRRGPTSSMRSRGPGAAGRPRCLRPPLSPGTRTYPIMEPVNPAIFGSLAPAIRVAYWGTCNRICLWCSDPPETSPTTTPAPCNTVSPGSRNTAPCRLNPRRVKTTAIN
jgi:hypothetical protein